MPPRPQGRSPRRVPTGMPRDPRFVRARGGARDRDTWRARLVGALRVGTLAIVMLGSGWYVQRVMTSGEAFEVQHLRVMGHSRLSIGEVEGLLAGLRGRNIVLTGLEEWRLKLLSSPWVRDASLRRALPDTIEVRLVERTPMAVAHAGETLWLIDELGTVVDEFTPRHGALDLPIVEGLMDADASAATMPDPMRVALVSSALQSLREGGLLGRVSQIDVSHVRNVAVLLNDDPVLLHVGFDRFAERVQDYLDMKDRLARMVDGVESVDLRFGNRVYVRPRKPGATFVSLPDAPDEGAVAEALAEPEDGDAQQQ